MRSGKHCKLNLIGVKAVPGCICMLFCKEIRAWLIIDLSWLDPSSSTLQTLPGYVCELSSAQPFPALGWERQRGGIQVNPGALKPCETLPALLAACSATAQPCHDLKSLPFTNGEVISRAEPGWLEEPNQVPADVKANMADLLEKFCVRALLVGGMASSCLV